MESEIEKKIGASQEHDFQGQDLSNESVLLPKLSPYFLWCIIHVSRTKEAS